MSTHDTGLWLRRFHPIAAAGEAPSSATVSLYCFPHAGGSAGYYRPLSEGLIGDGLDVAAVQYPGRQDRLREAPFLEIHQFADALADVFEAELAAASPTRPYAFFGHSMGAILAYETAVRLEQRGHVPGPSRLFVSGRRAPSTVRDERVHLGGDEAVVAELRRLAGTDTRLLDDPDVLAMVLPATRADYRAIETYTPRQDGPVECPITVLIGDDDPKSTVDEARAWAKHTARECDVHVLSGGHFYLAEQPEAVLALLRAHIAPAR